MNTFSSRLLLPLSLGFCLQCAAVQGADWPHWLGPQGTNIAPLASGPAFEGQLEKWSVAWKMEVGRGYSAVAVAGERAITLGHDGAATETVYCLNAGTGALLWKFSYPAQLIASMHTGGPNATATILAGKVLTVSKDGQVFCLGLEKGEKLWQASLPEVLEVPLPNWGFSSSPVVDGQSVFLGGGKVGALDLESGKPRWTSKNNHAPSYATPTLFEMEGKKFIAALDGKGVCILSATDGAEIARRPFKAMFDMTASTPIVLKGGKRLLISGNASSEMLGFDGKALSLIWNSQEFKNALNNSVVVGENLFGIDGRQGSSSSRFVCLTLETGKVSWNKPNFGYGSTIGIEAATGAGTPWILALTENGELVSLKAAVAGYQEAGRQQILGKTCWTTPVFANGRIYARNDQGQLVCLAPR